MKQQESSQQVQKKLFTAFKAIGNNPSILSKDITVDGNIKSNSVIEIEGNFDGNIKGKKVCIRKEAKVKGFIESDCLDIEGNFDGKIKSKSINIFKNANIISSKIEYLTLSVEDGACIDAHFVKKDLKDKVA